MRGFVVACSLFFTKKTWARSPEEFVSLVRQRKGVEVRIHPGKRNIRWLSSSGLAGVYAYGSLLVCSLPNGREVRFVKIYFKARHNGKVLERTKSKKRAEKKHRAEVYLHQLELQAQLSPIPVILENGGQTAPLEEPEPKAANAA